MQCVRSYISEKSACPSCRKTANEGHLRPNVAMEEVVSQWKEARYLNPSQPLEKISILTYHLVGDSSLNWPKLKNHVSPTHPSQTFELLDWARGNALTAQIFQLPQPLMT